jgi:hypothetical protein
MTSQRSEGKKTRIKDNFACTSYYYMNTDEAHPSKGSHKVEEPIPDTLRFRTTKESKLDMKKN